MRVLQYFFSNVFISSQDSDDGGRNFSNVFISSQDSDDAEAAAIPMVAISAPSGSWGGGSWWMGYMIPDMKMIPVPQFANRFGVWVSGFSGDVKGYAALVFLLGHRCRGHAGLQARSSGTKPSACWPLNLVRVDAGLQAKPSECRG